MLHNHIVSAIALWLALTLPAGAAEPPHATAISAEPEAAVQWLSTLPPPDVAETVTPSATTSAETLTPEQSPAVDATADTDAVDATADTDAVDATADVDAVDATADTDAVDTAADVDSAAADSLDEVSVDQGDAPASLSELLISGASTIQPILASLAATHQAQGGLPLRISGGGSGRGISDARAGSSTIGMVSRSLRDSEKADLRYSTLALDTLVFIVHAENPQTSISRSLLADVYTGRTNWAELNGWPWPVRLVSKEVGRSTLDLFEEFTQLNSPERTTATGTLISREATVIGSNLEALTLVGGQRGAIGYVSLGAAQSMQAAGLPIRILDLDGVTPSAQTIQSGRYPIRRELNLVYPEDHPAITALLNTLNSPEGQRVIEQAGFIPTGGR